MLVQIAEHAGGNITVLKLSGRLILDNCSELRDAVDALVEQGRPKVVLDVQDVTYIDSAGLGVLASKYLSVRRAGGDIKLVHLGARSAHVLDITHLDRIFETFDSEDEAIRSFQ
jgi:anti-sigma B factor antagonist